MGLTSSEKMICDALSSLKVGHKVIFKAQSISVDLLWYFNTARSDKDLYDLILTDRDDGTCEAEIKEWKHSGLTVGGGPTWFNMLMGALSLLVIICFIWVSNV